MDIYPGTNIHDSWNTFCKMSVALWHRAVNENRFHYSELLPLCSQFYSTQSWGIRCSVTLNLEFSSTYIIKGDILIHRTGKGIYCQSFVNRSNPPQLVLVKCLWVECNTLELIDRQDDKQKLTFKPSVDGVHYRIVDRGKGFRAQSYRAHTNPFKEVV